MAETITFTYTETGETVTVTLNENARGPAGADGSSAWADITGKPAAVIALSGTNTGDQDLSAYATITGSQALTNKTINGVTITASNGIGGLYLGGIIDTRSLSGVSQGGLINTSGQTSGAGGYIDTHGETGFAGGNINTAYGGGSILTQGSGDASGGYIYTYATGETPGGNIDTTAGGSFTTGTGNLTGPASSGTIALTSDFVGVIVTKKDGTRTHYPPSADTDTARGLALEAAMAAAIAGDTIDLSPGSYYVGKATSTIAGLVAQYAILDKMTIRLNGAYLWKQNTDTASTMFNPNATSGINDWSIIGPGTIEGSYADTSNTTGARGSAAAEIGINVAASRRWRIENVAIRNFAGVGLQLNNATYPVDSYGVLGTKASTGIVIGCNLDLNNIALQQGQNNEFVTFLGCTFNKNLTAFDSYGGNTKFGLCEFMLNTNYAFRLRGSGGTNYGHGEITGCAISHNSGFAVYAEAGMTNGYMFTGCQFGADSSSTNKIESLGAGLTFTGCILDSPIFASGTPAGINTIKNCFIIGSLAAFDAGVSAAERAKWKCQNNHSTSGVWASDDIRTTYADDATAGTGGVLQGELWQQTTTGAIFAKL